jgi:maltose alpha-D-glucosyltransferase/alpha-amylase
MDFSKEIGLENDPLWYKDAVIYELHVRAFYDSNGDGIGDFKGLVKKLDYLQNLGVNTIWLLPFYPSPLKDDGYDISDYKNIHPDYGTLRDFKEFLKQAHLRGLRVITELILNHTSDQHPWFKKAKEAKPGSVHREFYVWSDNQEKYKEARVIFQDYESSNWSFSKEAGAYYWHRFYSHQPDLNFDSPKVRKEIIDIVDFWLELGVDGLRLDAVPYLYEREGTNCENLPQTHAFLKELRRHVDDKFRDKMLLAEANQWPEDAVSYFGQGDECQMAFNFPIMPRLFMAVQMEDRFPVVDILDPSLEIPQNCQWALFLRNHDELTLEMVTDEERDYMYRVYATDPRTKINLGIRRRLAPLMNNNAKKIELMNVLLFSLPGTPIVYYGDEIGMGDNYYLGDRNGVRTPMQWGSDHNASFSSANPHKLYLPVIIDPEYHYEVINIENQEANLTSLLWIMRRLIATRKKFKAFSRGKINFLSPQNPKILAFTREFEDEIVLVVVNLSRFCQPLELDLSQYAGYVPEEVFGIKSFPTISRMPYPMTMGPSSYFWFQLKKPTAAAISKKERVIPEIETRSVADLVEGRLKSVFEDRILVEFLINARWFRSKGRTVRKINVVESAPADPRATFAKFLLLEVKYTEGMPEIYLLPVMYFPQEQGLHMEQNFPQAIIAKLKVDSQAGFLVDGMYSEELQAILLDSIAKRKKIKGKAGFFTAYPGKFFKHLLADKKYPLKSWVLKGEQSNTSIIYDEAFVFKLYRKLEIGKHPDVELTRTLTEKGGSKEIPPFAGAIEYQQPGSDSMFTGLLEAYVANQGEAWTFALDHFGQYYDRILSKKDELKEPPQTQPLMIDIFTEKENPLQKELLGGLFAELIALFGKRTAELHLSLASVTDDPDFAPEPFSSYYQRSIFQSMRSTARQSFSLLRKHMDSFSEEIENGAKAILAAEAIVNKRFARVMEKKISSLKIRIHGDYHLGQVLFTGKDFVVIDFEGEPARALSERRLKRSALQDVAGMIRSFHYAAYAALLKHPGLRPEDRNSLDPWVVALYHYVSGIFIRAYLKTAQKAPFVPEDRDEFNILFEALLLDKAIYELGYEINNRPDWIIIPIKGIIHLLSVPGEKNE